MGNVIAITARSAVCSEPKKLIRLLFSLQLILLSLYGRKVGAEEQVALNGDRFKVFEVDLTSNDLSLHWRRPDGLPFLNLLSVREEIGRSGGEVLFLTNAGIFDRVGFFNPEPTPKGLYVESGKTLQGIDRGDGEGNFYLKPNGIFILNESKAFIRRVDEIAEPISAQYALQSGPLLLRDKAIHPSFNPSSTNRLLRSGVGIRGTHELVFALSRVPVSFYEFASFFQDDLNCSDALFLDGVISRFLEGDSPMPTGEEQDFAAIFAVTKRR